MFLISNHNSTACHFNLLERNQVHDHYSFESGSSEILQNILQSTLLNYVHNCKKTVKISISLGKPAGNKLKFFIKLIFNLWRNKINSESISDPSDKL